MSNHFLLCKKQNPSTGDGGNDNHDNPEELWENIFLLCLMGEFLIIKDDFVTNKMGEISSI